MKPLTTLKKVLLSIAVLTVVMLILPILVIQFAPADAGMALCFILFFALDPVTVIGLGILAGTEIKRLWWIPLVSAIVFPLFFAIAIGELVPDLFLYSALYLCVGLLASIGTHLGMKLGKSKNAEK